MMVGGVGRIKVFQAAADLIHAPEPPLLRYLRLLSVAVARRR
jgi:hypothetical protein